MFPDVGALNKCFIFIFKGFCKVFLNKYIVKLAFSDLGVAQVFPTPSIFAKSGSFFAKWPKSKWLAGRPKYEPSAQHKMFCGFPI